MPKTPEDIALESLRWLSHTVKMSDDRMLKTIAFWLAGWLVQPSPAHGNEMR